MPDSLRSGLKAADEKSIPEEYRGRSGSITADKTLPQLKAFLEAGGTILAIGSSTSLAQHLEIPVRNALMEMGSDGKPKSLGSEKFYVPGSLLRLRLDAANPLAAGMPEQVDVFFRRSPAFHLGPEAVLRRVRPVAWFDTAAPLRSGWAWGSTLDDAIAVAEAPVGKGSLLLYGPEIAAGRSRTARSNCCSTGSTTRLKRTVAFLLRLCRLKDLDIGFRVFPQACWHLAGRRRYLAWQYSP